MKRRHVGLALVILGLAALALAATATANHPGGGGVKISTPMSGAEECNRAGTACNLGDPDGSGFFSARINVGHGELCYSITVANIDIANLTGAHIHVAPAGFAGDIVIHLSVPTGGSVSECITGLDRDLLKDIIKNPEAYYVNVHNTAFPGGAVRGQLEKG